MDTPPIIYTVGHSNASLEHFLALLQSHDIALLVDTRSYPASRYVPHFGRHRLEQALSDVGVRYCYLGDKLGGRPVRSISMAPTARWTTT